MTLLSKYESSLPLAKPYRSCSSRTSRRSTSVVCSTCGARRNRRLRVLRRRLELVKHPLALDDGRGQSDHSSCLYDPRCGEAVLVLHPVVLGALDRRQISRRAQPQYAHVTRFPVHKAFLLSRLRDPPLSDRRQAALDVDYDEIYAKNGTHYDVILLGHPEW